MSDNLNYKPLGLLPEIANNQNTTTIDWLLSIESYDFSKILKRLIKIDGLKPNKSEKAKKEFLRFISLIKFGHNSISPSNLADIFWHAFILHTKDYEEFCNYYFGYFIHHVPFDSEKNNLDELLILKSKSEKLISIYYGTKKSNKKDKKLCISI